MKFLNSETTKAIGNVSPFGNLIGKVYYLSGVEQFDPLIKEKVDDLSRSTTFNKHERGFELMVGSIFKREKIAIPFDSIKSISLESRQHIEQQKEKSVVGRALLGGLLLGPIGAMVGGMSGLQPSGSSIVADHILTFSFDDNGEDYVILFHVHEKDKSAVEKFFAKTLSEKFQTNIIPPEPEVVGGVPKLDIVEQLSKLAVLKDKGILTEEEFLAQKSKMLA
ncbi:MAG: SHOCT domain-containing protein [Bacteroidota bacterium]|nr:SHOCT domain-containing protein [Bacteroidota bacterium]MDP4232137.1 SHOCT domain-containing protein [Bacteroidota bacterium]MDP4241155.1 SHOCT domain-containing protein [Bacteroidota bacterium]MDP4286547.1 SHOCT domain-containing protein [Bacteroidota bacterium]